MDGERQKRRKERQTRETNDFLMLFSRKLVWTEEKAFKKKKWGLNEKQWEAKKHCCGST